MNEERNLIWGVLAPYIADENGPDYGEREMEELCANVLPGVWETVIALTSNYERLLDLVAALGFATSEASAVNTERANELWRALPDDLRQEIERREEEL